MDFITAVTGDGERRAELPSVGNHQGGGVVDVVGLVSLGIQQNLVPADNGELRGGGGAGGEAAFKSGWGDKVEIGLDFAYALRDLHMDGESVLQIPAPFKCRTIGFETVPCGRAEEQAREIDDRAIGSVFAWNPFRVVESQVTRSRGNGQSGVEDLAGSCGGVDGNGDIRRSGGEGGDRRGEETKNSQDFQSFHSANPRSERDGWNRGADIYDYSSHRRLSI